jgi:pimeloyl-ACP methyl ester carboxylesterase
MDSYFKENRNRIHSIYIHLFEVSHQTFGPPKPEKINASGSVAMRTNKWQRFAAPDRTQQRFRLPEGRCLGYAEYGDARGMPVFYFHGFPGSRLEAGLAEQESVSLGIRLIAMDRPGYGLSNVKRNRTLLDWADDTVQLADFLGLRRFSIIGVSGGGPYAAACAFRIPDRLNMVAVVGGLGPVVPRCGRNRATGLTVNGLLLAGRFPIFARLALAAAALMYREHPELMLALISRRFPECDRQALQISQLHRLLCDSFREAFRRSLLWPAWDVVLYGRDWGFRLHDIRVPVRLWHGEQDVVVPPVMAHRLADEIPACRAVFDPEEGHFSTIVKRLAEILAELSRR